MKAQINFRKGGFYLTEISEEHTPESLARRMVGGGFVVAHDKLWNKERWIPINLSDVDSIILTYEHKND